uniref:Uncharacterized protein n=1 Tax=Anguilla anguilla TaxID=7936 RepID=A0A0E9WHR9_ANGAN
MMSKHLLLVDCCLCSCLECVLVRDFTITVMCAEVAFGGAHL